MHEITYLYLDFIERIKYNITEARDKFMENDDFKRMLKDMNIPSENILATFYNTLSTDLKNLKNSILFYESFFIIMTYGFELLLLLFLIIMTYYNEMEKNALIFVSKILKKN